MRKKLKIIIGILVLIIVCIILYDLKKYEYAQFRRIDSGFSYDIKLNTKKMSDYQITMEGIEKLKQTPDDYRLEARFIDPINNTSIKIDKMSQFSRVINKENEVAMYDFNIINTKDVYMKLYVFSKKSAKLNLRTDDIRELILLPDIGGIEYFMNWDPYRVDGLFEAYINTADSKVNSAIIRDVNGNFTVIKLYDKKMLDIKDIVANFEVFDADGYRYINDVGRDGVYIDTIKSVKSVSEK